MGVQSGNRNGEVEDNEQGPLFYGDSKEKAYTIMVVNVFKSRDSSCISLVLSLWELS
jgi:hypothetical protein